MSLDVEVLDEPLLEFRFGQKLTDPKSGLSLFGAYDTDDSTWPGQIPYAVVGTAAGIETFARFTECLAEPVVSSKYLDPKAGAATKLLWPPYPGFSAMFGAAWQKPGMTRVINDARLSDAARHMDKYQRAYQAANVYLDAIRAIAIRDENFKAIICVVPDEVWENCRPRSAVVGGLGAKTSRKERDVLRTQIDAFNPYAGEEYDLSVDFRRQLKARAMEHRVPLQLVRESTLVPRDSVDADSRGLTPLSDRAWNLGTTLYYKSGGKPWRLASARDGVCYIGLAFRQSELENEPGYACCAAQMFLDTGDGVVFQGRFGPWYAEKEDGFHLSRSAAAHLLTGVLKEYGDGGGKPLTEIFLHSQSTIDAEEWTGYQSACPPGVKLVGVRVRRDREGMRLFRTGDWPVLRGTLWVLRPRVAYLWGSGFKPSVLSYDGWEVPVPLRIDIEHGDADVRQVARDILGLTKLNYNTCKLGDAKPVTVGFSSTVGEILIGNPKIRVRLPSFRYYI